MTHRTRSASASALSAALLQQREIGCIPARLWLLIEPVARACKRIAMAAAMGALANCWLLPAPRMRRS